MSLGIYAEESFPKTLFRLLVVAGFVWSLVYTIHEMITDDFSGIIIGLAGFLFTATLIAAHLWREIKKENAKSNLGIKKK